MPRKNLTIDLAGSGVRFARINADQTTDELTAAEMLAALGERYGYLAADVTQAATTANSDFSFTLPDGTTSNGFAIAAGEIWQVDAMFQWFQDDGGGSPDGAMKFTLLAPSGGLISGVASRPSDGLDSVPLQFYPAAQTAIVGFSEILDTRGAAHFSVIVDNPTNSGTVSFRKAKQSAGIETGTIFKGGYFRAKRLN